MNDDTRSEQRVPLYPPGKKRFNLIGLLGAGITADTLCHLGLALSSSTLVPAFPIITHHIIQFTCDVTKNGTGQEVSVTKADSFRSS